MANALETCRFADFWMTANSCRDLLNSSESGCMAQWAGGHSCGNGRARGWGAVVLGWWVGGEQGGGSVLVGQAWM